MRFLILGNASKPQAVETAQLLHAVLADHGTVVLTDLHQEKDLSQVEADLALVLGGDGAILRAARQMGYRQVPVLGINLGKLGFLADLSAEDVVACLPQLLGHQYHTTQHLMFECVVESPAGTQTILGLNDVVVHTGPPFHMLDLELRIGDEAVSRFSGDGLILSTPVGSTAHSLSAGGPILGQELRVFVITPICAHTLTNRPLVDSAEKVYTISVRRGESVWLIVDGQDVFPLSMHHRVTVRQAPVHFQLVKVPGRTYYQTLRDKLRWGTTPHYRIDSNPPP